MGCCGDRIPFGSFQGHNTRYPITPNLSSHSIDNIKSILNELRNLYREGKIDLARYVDIKTKVIEVEEALKKII